MASRTSRKKNKGKERKAKRVEAERTKAHENWWGLAIGGDKYNGKTITCDHGCKGLLPNNVDHPVSYFLDEIFTLDSWGAELLAKMLQTKGEPILNNQRYREILIIVFISIGTNMLLDGGHIELMRALILAKTISLLEHHNSGDGLAKAVNNRVVAIKRRDLEICLSSRRDALKFFSKRVPCSCLKKMHQEARRTFPKTGQCAGCKKEKARDYLLVCSRCMIAQFCSRECQVAYWPKHERFCDKYRHIAKLGI